MRIHNVSTYQEKIKTHHLNSSSHRKKNCEQNLQSNITALLGTTVKISFNKFFSGNQNLIILVLCLWGGVKSFGFFVVVVSMEKKSVFIREW